ncbi:MAG: tetratricopeptide repeat protein [Deltaproteobacteria bacterium]|nr:tetratricopeptide repeat protein [Deltaproteobacteria bacterium]MBW1871540.1 tetratricopeptide repeat protein [Deltaproteobacteria bacterium]
MRVKLLLVITVWAIIVQACMATAPIHPEAKRHNQTGVANLQKGSLQDAAVCFRLSLEYNPCHADALHNLALVYMFRGNLTLAEQHELEALECRPDLVQAVNGLGSIYRSRLELDRAAELFSQAVSMDPGYLDARRNLILTMLDLGQPNRAQKHIDRLKILSPGDPFLVQIEYRLAR